MELENLIVVVLPKQQNWDQDAKQVSVSYIWNKRKFSKQSSGSDGIRKNRSFCFVGNTAD